MVHPCCGSSLQQGTKFLAMLSMIISVAGVAWTAFSLFERLLSSPKVDESLVKVNPENGEEEPENFTSTVILMFFFLLTFIFNLFLSILLFIGAEQKNLRLLEVWLKVSIVLFIVDLVLLAQTIIFPQMINSKKGTEAEIDYSDTIISTNGIIYSVYELWVVYAFICEIKSLKDMVSGSPTDDTTV